jgi:hypothetical protein
MILRATCVILTRFDHYHCCLRPPINLFLNISSTIFPFQTRNQEPGQIPYSIISLQCSLLTSPSIKTAPRNSSTPWRRQLRTPHRKTPYRILLPFLLSPPLLYTLNILTQSPQNRLNILHGGTIASMVDLGGSLAVASRGLFATGVSTDLNGLFYLQSALLMVCLSIESFGTDVFV